jgi:uncharacterized protein (TIGR03790 family)
MNRCGRILALALLGPALLASAGGGPLNTLVVVNRASRDSRALGAYYAEQRGIPPSHLCTIKTDARSPSISLEAFERDIRAPILAHIANHKLEGQIHFLVLCMDIPSRVENFNGITAALFYGYKPPTPGAPKCNIAPTPSTSTTAPNPPIPPPPAGTRPTRPSPSCSPPTTSKPPRQVVDRGVASDASFPDGLFCLHGSPDTMRNIRHRTYPPSPASSSSSAKAAVRGSQSPASPVPNARSSAT